MFAHSLSLTEMLLKSFAPRLALSYLFSSLKASVLKLGNSHSYNLHMHNSESLGP
jgi:hypothetical protein